MAELLAIPENESPESVAARYHHVGLEYQPGITDVDMLLTDAVWEKFSRQTQARILLEQARDAAHRLVLIDAAVLAACGAAYLQQWYETVSGKLVGIVSADVQLPEKFNCDHVLLMASDRSVSVAAAQWCLDNAGTVGSWFDRHSVQKETSFDDDVFDDE